MKKRTQKYRKPPGKKRPVTKPIWLTSLRCSRKDLKRWQRAHTLQRKTLDTEETWTDYVTHLLNADADRLGVV